MRQPFKGIIALSLIVLAAGVLAGCGGQSRAIARLSMPRWPAWA